MKKHLLHLSVGLIGLTSSHGAIVLLGGYYGLNESGDFLQSPTLSGSGISTSLTRSGTANTDITQGVSQINTTAWGTTSLDVDAPTIGNGDNSRNGIFQGAAVSAGTHILNLTITNGSSNDLVLDAIHFIVKKDIANAGPNLQSLTYSAGNLADSTGTGTGNFAISNGVVGYDIDLSSFLTDTTLSAGESATFTWNHGDAEDPLGNTALRIDNLAISGEAIPEPSAALLGGLGVLALLRRRR